jgi:hypothetical protein
MPSSVIRAYTYHPAERRLDVEFVTGRRYSYFDVPEAEAAALDAAASKGGYFNRRIRDRYRFRRCRALRERPTQAEDPT